MPYTHAEIKEIKALQADAERGDLAAQCKLGDYFDSKKEPRLAVRWYRAAAEKGYADAQWKLGEYFFDGIKDVIAKDEKQAVELYRQAADQEHADAQFSLGFCLDQGKGVAKDEVKAVEFYRKAAEKGHAMAQFKLATYLFRSEVDEDIKLAMKCYYDSAKQGYTPAQYHLGFYYFKGIGVDQDLLIAKEWLTEAYTNGHPQASETLEKVEKQISDMFAQAGVRYFP